MRWCDRERATGPMRLQQRSNLRRHYTGDVPGKRQEAVGSLPGEQTGRGRDGGGVSIARAVGQRMRAIPPRDRHRIRVDGDDQPTCRLEHGGKRGQHVLEHEPSQRTPLLAVEQRRQPLL